jgi:hypothetical protein
MLKEWARFNSHKSVFGESGDLFHHEKLFQRSREWFALNNAVLDSGRSENWSRNLDIPVDNFEHVILRTIAVELDLWQ